MPVTLYEKDRAIGRVPYNSTLDRWDGHNWTSGSTGHHLGIGRTRSGKYYLVYGSQWQGERNRAEVVSREEAQTVALEHEIKDELYEELFGEQPPGEQDL